MIKEDPTKFEDEEKIEGLKFCSSWFDGCNTCRVEEGKILECTRKFCFRLAAPRCLTKTAIESPLEGCEEWMDGCKTCDVKQGIPGNTCTTDVADCKADTKKKPYCKKMDTAFSNRVGGKKGEAQDYLKGCATWFDGCNKCKVTTDGKLGECTKEFCDKNDKAYCAEKTGAVAKVKDTKQKALEKCAQWFNGCNYCDVQDGKLGKCTRNKCTLFRRPFCKVPIETKYKDVVIEQKDCGVWYDGCNTCKVVNGELKDCTEVFCETPTKSYCQEKPNEIKKRKPVVPAGCVDFFDGCNDCSVKNGKKQSCTAKTCVATGAAKCKKEKTKGEC